MSDQEASGFSTPVPELDDHQQRSNDVPVVPRHARRPTNSAIRPIFTEISTLEDTCALEDSNSIHDIQTAGIDRCPSYAPRARRSTFVRNDPDNRSRRSNSTDSSQSWQPTSVDAFAFRRRAGTIDSVSDVEDVVQRTISSIHRNKRPTELEGGITLNPSPVATPSEDNVCYPLLRSAPACKIDYDDLEEYLEQLRADNSALGRGPSFPANRKSHLGHDISVGSTESSNMVFTEKSQGTEADDDVDGPSPAQLCTVPVTPEITVPRYTFFSSELEDTIFAFSLSGLLAEDEKMSDLFDPAIESGGVWWLDMLNPSKEAVVAICKAFDVHPLTREDILTQETREKVELFKSYYFVCFRSFCSLDKTSEHYMDPVNIYAVVFKEGLLTFSFCNNPHAKNVRSRIGKLRDYLQLSADWICYALIDDIVDTFAPVIHDIELESDSIEDEVLIARVDDSRQMLQRMSTCRKKVMQLIRLLGGKADVIKGFAKRCNESYEVAPCGDVRLYLSDIQDHVVTMMGNLTHFEKMLGRSHSNYLAQLSIDHLQQGNNVNQTLGKVTLIATILVPLNLVTGLFGMNVHVPGSATEGGLGWFFGIVGCLILIVFTALCLAKRFKFF